MGGYFGKQQDELYDNDNDDLENNSSKNYQHCVVTDKLTPDITTNNSEHKSTDELTFGITINNNKHKSTDELTFGVTINNNEHKSTCEFACDVLLMLTEYNRNMRQFIDENREKIKCETHCFDNLILNNHSFNDINRQISCHGKICLRIMWENIVILNFVVEIKQHGINNNNKVNFIGLKNNSEFQIKEETYNVPENKLNYDIFNINNTCTFTHPFLFETEKLYCGTIVVDFYTNFNEISFVYNEGYRLREILSEIIKTYNCPGIKFIINNPNSSLCKYLKKYNFANKYPNTMLYRGLF
jgi:hypothetical protein